MSLLDECDAQFLEVVMVSGLCYARLALAAVARKPNVHGTGLDDCGVHGRVEVSPRIV